MSDCSPIEVRQSLEALYRSDSSRILASLVRLLGDLDLAEDAMQEAFSAALNVMAEERHSRKSEALVDFDGPLQSD
jgi:RNA polymerase sigma-70 factor (ECF subfamily)